MTHDHDQQTDETLELGVASTATQGFGVFIAERYGAYDLTGITND